VDLVFDAKVGFIFDAFRLVFRNLTFTYDFVQVDGSRVWSGVPRDQKPCTTIEEGDVFCLVDNHAKVAMLSASILGCDAARGIGLFLPEQV
jgi:hypothetical protein